AVPAPSADRAYLRDLAVGVIVDAFEMARLDPVAAVDDDRRGRIGALLGDVLLGATVFRVDREAGHGAGELRRIGAEAGVNLGDVLGRIAAALALEAADRKSTRLNSSHVKSPYAGFGLKNKKEDKI